MIKASRVLMSVFLAGALSLPAVADETGMASMHSWRKVGKKTCMIDHYHSGSGTGASRQAAETAALRDWSGFTALEYGSTWADARIAVNKSMTCNRTGATDFACQVQGIACRPF